MRIFVTGGAGYVGAHVAVMAVREGHEVMVLDDLSNSSPERFSRLIRSGVRVVEGDIFDTDFVSHAMQKFGTERLIHLAAKKYADESEIVPFTYWRDNVGGTVSVLEAALECGNPPIVFSSTAAVYGSRHCEWPVFTEKMQPKPSSAYAKTKLTCEELLEAHVRQFGGSAISLRYFNPVGSLPGFSELRPKSLFSTAAAVSLGRLEYLPIYRSSSPTGDGTGVRDFVHVEDAASAHLALPFEEGQHKIYNVGTGRGTTVMRVVEEFERALGRELPKKFENPRPGDAPASVADCSLIERETGWKARHSLGQMVRDTLIYAEK